MQTFTQDEQSAVGHKRYTPRWNMQADCVCSTNKDNMTYEGHIKDVSCSGACLTTDKGFNIDQNLNLTLYLPHKGAVEICGTAVWSKAVNSHHEIGIHFFNASSEAQEAILKYAVNSNHELLKDYWFRDWQSK